jgi:hypothetical protein
MAKSKWAKPDPYETYRDGNCRDISGQIVPCGDDSAISPPKFAEGDEPDRTDENKDE